MQSTKLLLATLLVPLGVGLIACAGFATPTPAGPPGPGPTWQPQEAIHAVESTPGRVEAVAYSGKDVAWNAEFDPYAGRWRVTAIYRVQALYPPRVERKSIYWYVYEDTGLIDGPMN
ncbi:MAG: hypothetical protein ACE5Q6_10090 [Dehalococcoidia bacterium]